MQRLVRIAALAGFAATAGCGPDPGTRAAAYVTGASECHEGALGPATAAPAVGLWANRDGQQFRVTARIGPPQPTGSAAGAVSHRVETLESMPSAPSVRATSDSATVRLDLLPLYVDDRAIAESTQSARREPHPAATYAVSERVVLASYEPCALTDPEPLLRYIRRDEGSRVVTDVMLRRQSVAP